jgi:hypothetical protein
MTRDDLETQLGRLFILKGAPTDTEPYWEALRDIPVEVLAAGISHAIKTRAWFPAPAEIRHDCDAAKPKKAMAVHPTSRMVPMDGAKTVTIANPFGGEGITVTITEEHQPWCDDCGDSGEVVMWCGDDLSQRWPWLPVAPCGRRHAHAPHDWARHCLCVERNPTILRRKEALRERYAQSPEKAA